MSSRTRALAAQAALWLALASMPALADSTAVAPRTRFGGQFFGDYLYTVAGSAEDSSAFQIRRIYLMADRDLSERIAARVTIEAENGTVAANGRLSAFLKFAYLEFKEVWPGASLFAGLAPTPLWQTTEEVWGYRSVEKTPLDFRGFGSSSDLGVALRGHLGDGSETDGRGVPVEYHLMFANGSTQKPESDRSKKGYANLTIRSGPFVLEPHVDFEGGPGNDDRSTAKLLAGWEAARWAVGVEGWVRMERIPEPSGISAFARTRIGERFAVFGRYDRFDPDPPTAIPPNPSFISHDVFVGLDWMPIPDVHVIPNLALEAFTDADGSGAGRRSEAVARITLAYQYRDP